MSWLICSQMGLNRQSLPIRFQSKHHERRPMPSLLLAPPKMFLKTLLWLLAKQKIETPVSSGKIPTRRAAKVSQLIFGNEWFDVGPTLRNDLPDEHDKEDGPEKTDTLRSHLVVIVKCLEEVGRRDCGEAVRPMVKTGV